MCPSFVLGGDANTGSAGYICLETELMGWESEFYAAMLAAFAFAAFLGLPSFFAVVCPGAATLFQGGENDFYTALFAAFAFAALMGWPSCFAVASPAVLAALSGGTAYMGSAGFMCLVTAYMLAAFGPHPRSSQWFALPATLFLGGAMLDWAALSDGYGGMFAAIAFVLR